MNRFPSNTSLVPGYDLLQDYDLIDYLILEHEQKIEEMEQAGHVFCPMCCIEIVYEEEYCERCCKVES